MRMFTVDAFAAKPFSGNPAAVCLADGVKNSAWMQDVAREMNLSETAYISKRDDGYDLRWFTPGIEVELCGHATLASAHILWEERLAPRDEPIVFHTRSGELTCRNAHTGRIEMDFPVCPVTEATPPHGFLEALGADPKFVGSSAVGFIVELPTEAGVRALRPDFAAMRQMSEDAWACVTAPAEGGGFDFVSRFFAPQGGVDEDPVTGSAHCALAYFWSQKTGRTAFRAYQCSARGGVVHAELVGDRVMLGGQAVTVSRGELVAGAPV
jgi:predicted PhzF superfamily epimerase YddE/YHI9